MQRVTIRYPPTSPRVILQSMSTSFGLGVKQLRRTPRSLWTNRTSESCATVDWKTQNYLLVDYWKLKVIWTRRAFNSKGSTPNLEDLNNAVCTGTIVSIASFFVARVRLGFRLRNQRFLHEDASDTRCGLRVHLCIRMQRSKTASDNLSTCATASFKLG